MQQCAKQLVVQKAFFVLVVKAFTFATFPSDRKGPQFSPPPPPSGPTPPSSPLPPPPPPPPVNFNRSTTTVTASAVVPNPTLFLAPTAERDFNRSSAAVACTVTHYCTHEVAWAAAAEAAANIDSFPSFLPVLFMCRSETTNESSPFAPPLPPLSTEEKRIIEGEGAENTRNSLEQKRE